MSVEKSTYSRADLIQDVWAHQTPKSDGSLLSKKQIEAIVKDTLHKIADTVRSGRDVQLKGFALFKLKMLKARKGRNPRTGKTLNLPERRRVLCRVTFKLDDESTC